MPPLPAVLREAKLPAAVVLLAAALLGGALGVLLHGEAADLLARHEAAAPARPAAAAAIATAGGDAPAAADPPAPPPPMDGAERRAHHHRAVLLAQLGGAAALLPLALAAGLLLRRRARTGHDAVERLRHLARHDPLTGLANRGHLHERLADALAEAEREGGSAAVLIVDLDRFKDLNDQLGPVVGDALLREAAGRLAGAVRQRDLVARIGPDVFAVVQDGAARGGGASPARLAERLSGRMREPYPLGNGQSAPGGATVGFAVGPADGADPAVLLRRAETALRRAKAEARGGWRGYDAGMDAELQARRALERELRAATAAGAFALHYQPLHALPGRERVGWEALLRWPHPRRGLVSPGEFIPLAEETGLIVPLGAWALRTACRDAARWPGAERLAVNLSPAQFRQGDIVATVGAALRDSGLAPSRLELEITEGLLLHNTEGVLRQLDALRALGVRIVMDDFGTGYSSLGYLWRFPFDKLKIDRSFVRDLERDRRAAAIVATIIGLARALRIPVTAEGVETEAQMRALAEAGCDQVQGFLLGRPAPLAMVEAERAAEAAGVIRLRAAAE